MGSSTVAQAGRTLAAGGLSQASYQDDLIAQQSTPSTSLCLNTLPLQNPGTMALKYRAGISIIEFQPDR